MTVDQIQQTTQEPVDDEERRLMGPASWEWESAALGETVGTPGAILSVRFTRDEYLALGRLAGEAGVGPVELTRQTMLQLIADHRRERSGRDKRSA